MNALKRLKKSENGCHHPCPQEVLVKELGYERLAGGEAWEIRPSGQVLYLTLLRASLNTLSTEKELERGMLLTDGVCKSSNPCSQNKAVALCQITSLCRFSLKLEFTKTFFLVIP